MEKSGLVPVIKQLNFLFLLVLLLGCANAENYSKAFSVEIAGNSFITVIGKRRLAAHDLWSLLLNETYEDSLVMQIPSLKDGIIEANNIPFQRGYYKYTGSIVIKGNEVLINLNYNNTDDKKIEPASWNGRYILERR